MLNMLAVVALGFSPVQPIRPDTPPRWPIPVERLADLKTREDIIGASRLPDGSRPPSEMELPNLDNSREVLDYMLAHYPPELRDRYDFEMPWAWMFIDERGHPGEVRIVKSSGRAAFDSLSVAALRIARFTPGRMRGKAQAVWMPMPIQGAYKELADRAKTQPPQSGEPTFTPYTVKPELLNRDEVRRALVSNYPPALREAGTGGQVMMWLFVDADGRTVNTRIKTGSGNADLDRAAQTVAGIMRWQPARHQGEAVAVWIQVPIVFKSNVAPPKP